ncbi:MipA/OmpV family protein [Roseateles sp. LKC17W]|uniref:MipA/OmpV family protein n=1 Tax=Pelomonas margarita TaxID=3299031 RepID=A0ABW7FI62_9BURK
MRTLYLSSFLLAPALASVALLGAPLAQAQGGPGGMGGPGREGQSSWGLGIAAVSGQEAYKGIERETRALPMLSYENRWFRLGGLGAEVKLPRLGISDTQSIDFRLVGKFNMDGYEAKDSTFLAGMNERKGGFWAGAKATWRNDVAHLSAEWTADVSSHSKGQRFNLSLEKNFRLGPQLMLSPRVGASWMDKKYVDYYFGVRSHEVQAGRAASTGTSGVNAELGLRSLYMIDPHHAVFLDLGVTRLAKSIKNSPLVERSTENRVLMGYLYRF